MTGVLSLAWKIAVPVMVVAVCIVILLPVIFEALRKDDNV